MTIDELVVADPPETWAAAGFTVHDDVCAIGDVRIRLIGSGTGTGITGWSLRGIPDELTELDGVPTTRSAAAPVSPGDHPNGVTVLDHVVLLSPHLARTVAALAGIGLQPRRERDGQLGGAAIRQVFYRLGPVILEVVGSPDATADGPASLWGLTHVVTDIDATAALLGERTSPVKDAVQPGRRISTLRHRDFGMSVRTAMISA